jgi:hypothetical protein
MAIVYDIPAAASGRAGLQISSRPGEAFDIGDDILVVIEQTIVGAWLAGQSYASLRERGLDTIKSYADLTKFDDHELLATEFSFMVRVDGSWDEPGDSRSRPSFPNRAGIRR